MQDDRRAGEQLDGAASFATPTSQPFTYSFSGTLTSCQSNESAPTSGTVSAGKTITIGGVVYQEPPANGTGSCGSSDTSGSSVVTWADGTVTVINYTTKGALAAVVLSGSVGSVVLKSTDPTKPDLTLSSNRFAGSSASGTLAFEPPDPTACNGAGVTTAGIQGQVNLGHQ
jgi:hypothetical protein